MTAPGAGRSGVAATAGRTGVPDAHIEGIGHGPPAGAWRRALRRWAAGGAVVAVALAATGAATGLITYSHGRLRMVVLAERALTESEELRASLSSVQQAGRVGADERAEMAAQQRELRAALAGLRRSGVGSDAIAEVQRDMGPFLSGVSEVVRLLDRGDPATAREIERDRLDPIVERLEPAIRAATRDYEHAANDTDRLATGALLVLLPLAALVIVWLMRRAADAQARAAATDTARRAEARFGALVRHASDLTALCDRTGRVIFMSPAVRALMGYEPDEMLGTFYGEYVHPDDLHGVVAMLGGTRERGGSVTVACRLRHRDGTWRDTETVVTNLVRDPDVGAMVCNVRDVTERVALEHQLAERAFHDPLTGLANRALYQDRLAHAMVRARRGGQLVGVLLVDLDGFKTVNDSLGHVAGDEAIVAIATRLADCVRPGDTVARVGGDEFAVLVEDLHGRGGAETVAERILVALREPVEIGGVATTLTGSVGIALSGAGSGDLLRDADAAMYAAKAGGKDRLQVFEPRMHQRAVDRLGLLADLPRAVEGRELELHYQPIVELATNRVTGVEALVRWRHPTRGLLGPAAFVPLAEESGAIVEIGAWVFGEACRQLARWDAERTPGAALTMHVNLSVRQLLEPEIVGAIDRTLAETGIEPSRLVLEITESVLFDNTDRVLGTFRALHDLGVRLAIDDFGVGYSSLAYLRTLPVDIVKIDKSFVDAVLTSAEGRGLVNAIVYLSRVLRVDAVAEGVETRQQAAVLASEGCQRAQGFYFARPLPASECSAFFRDGARPAATPLATATGSLV